MNTDWTTAATAAESAATSRADHDPKETPMQASG